MTLTDPERAPDQALRTPSNLKLRMIASVGMIVVASIALTLGGIAFWLLGVVAALFMMAEWAMLQGADAKTRRHDAVRVVRAARADGAGLADPRRARFLHAGPACRGGVLRRHHHA
ncbi:hypothetical protein [Sphingomonas aerolata]|uniref:hypothetical protein n=1 Tax=Sphingomonas aerolata TaxID=185951 RepID=UPI002FDF7EB6